MSRFIKKAYKCLVERFFPNTSDKGNQEEVLSIDDLGGPSLRFKVATQVERYRTAQFGGEQKALERFLEALEPSDTIYDVGASVGLFTVAAASNYPESRVVAFEPDPEINQRLRTNISLNNLKDVQVIDWAASNDSGTVDLYTDGVDGFSPTMRPQSRDGAPSGTVSVEKRPIDEAIADEEIPVPNVLKIDIEGAEVFCLEGCRRLLDGAFGVTPRTLFVEVHPEFLPDYGRTEDDVMKILEDTDYRVEWRQQREEQVHLLCRRQDYA